MELEVFKTGDGSPTVRIPQWDEIYHSRRGAVSESVHVYIRNGLYRALDKKQGFPLRIFEMGLGTGLNVLLTMAECLKHPGMEMDYTGIESHPVPDPLWSRLDYSEFIKDQPATPLFRAIHETPWETANELIPGFSLTKKHASIEALDEKQSFDLIYYDAFGPRVQPELWTTDTFEKLKPLFHDETMLVTYCAKSVVKRSFREAGFKVTALPGPPGKREMISVTMD